MIRYHGTPFSGDTTTRLALRGRHAMGSFARPDDLKLVAELCQSFALDTGAFTAWTQGTPYDAEAFLAWAPFLRAGGTLVLSSTGGNEPGHDGPRRLLERLVGPPAFPDLRIIEQITFAVKV